MSFTKITFIPSDIEWEGTFLQASQYVDTHTANYIKTYLHTYLMMNPIDEVVDRLYAENPELGIGLYAGNITRDIDSLLNNIISAIAMHSFDKFEDPILAMSFNAAQVEMCSAKDLNIIIENAIRNCAAQDHFNEFEI